jgi:formylglycine-generating enzyme required for sulfatase activity
MGSDIEPEEQPVHRVHVDGFWMDVTAVTNAQYAAFVAATGWITVAERPLDPADFPGAPIENLVPGSLVFTPTSGPVDLRHLAQWWTWVPGASWRYPEGPRSGIDDRLDHPVVHVAWEDVAAYASWVGRKLPTEAEWERAARGGTDGRTYAWGDDAQPDGVRLAKWFEGEFPWRNEARDGHPRTAPVGSYPPNPYGLHEITGNVWEWTADWYGEHHDPVADKPCCVPANPRGGSIEGSYDRAQPQFRIPRRVIKGGSHLCADSYCRRYRPAARRPQQIDTGMSHIGFRTIRRVPADASVGDGGSAE